MRLVCKNWCSFVNNFEQREKLCIYDQVVPHKLKWTSDGAYAENTVKVKINELDFKDPFLKNVKRLFIYKIDKLGLLHSLNSLMELEELNFHWEKRGHL